MKRFDYILEAAEGIHARPAMALSKQAKDLKSQITVIHGERRANAKNMPALLTLRAFQGDTVTFLIEGETEEQDAEILKNFCEYNL